MSFGRNGVATRRVECRIGVKGKDTGLCNPVCISGGNGAMDSGATGAGGLDKDLDSDRFLGDLTPD